MTFSNGMVGEAEEGEAVIEDILDDFEYEQTSGEEEEETAASARNPSSGATESSTQKGRRAAEARADRLAVDAAKGSKDGKVDPSIYLSLIHISEPTRPY